MGKRYFKDKNFSLYHGNTLELLDKFEENSVDMIFADPPYRLSNDGFTVHAGKQVSVNKGKWDKSKGVEADFDFHRSWIAACKRILKKNGSIWISGTYHSIYACGHALNLEGYKILNEVSWFKPNAPPNLSCRYFTASHETLIWARKDPDGKHTFNYDNMKHGDWHESDKLKKKDKQMRSVWHIPTPKPSEKKHGKHPTQKSLDLLRRIVGASTNKGDLVVDPFTGSSTTGIAAIESGRKFIGIDFKEEYLDLSIKRYKDLLKVKRKVIA